MDLLEKFEIGPLLRTFYVKLYSNAIECANQLAPGLPIYVASDTDFGKEMKDMTKYSIRVAASDNDTGPLHIDSNDNQGRGKSDFYLIFVDLYVMARAKCLSHGSSFGVFSLKMSGNTCEVENTKTDCLALNST